MNLPSSIIKSLKEAHLISKSEEQPFVSIRHMVMGVITTDIDVRLACEDNGVNCDEMLHRVHFDIDAPNDIQGNKNLVRLITIEGSDESFGISAHLYKLLRKLIIHMSTSGETMDNTYSGVLLLILAMQEDNDSFMTWFSKETELKPDELFVWIDRQRRRREALSLLNDRGDKKASDMVNKEIERFAKGQAQQTPYLDKFCTNLNEKIKDKDTGFIGREKEITQVMRILARQSKCNPVLVGDPGVGKTAVVEGLAKLIAESKSPTPLENNKIYALDLGLLVSGTRYRGDFEGRMTELIKELQSEEGAILFIDEIHMLIGAGSGNADPMDASNLLKPLLQDGRIRCIGATTHSEYRKYIEKDPALARRLQVVTINEPSSEDALMIVEGAKARFESHHGVTFKTEAIEAAVSLSVRYIHDRKLPDKAIDLLDETAASIRIENNPVSQTEVQKGDVESVVSSITGIPLETISQVSTIHLRNMEASLRSKVFGQDEAMSELTNAVKVARAGLGDPEKPVGCFLFAGPTGVGKTEATKQLSSILGSKLIRIDMSEYTEPHSISRLIGSPPGYIGYHEEGILTGSIAKAPYSVLLLDEIEKGHPQVWNLLLQIMDYGKLTDATGKTVDFRNCILIMTSNVGVRAMNKSSIGFAQQHNDRSDMVTEEINDVFAPEFRNRLDNIIHFSSLSDSTTRKVIHKLLSELSEQMFLRKMILSYDDDVIEWIANLNYDRTMGARPLNRIVREKIKRPLAEELLFGDISDYARVDISIQNNDLLIQRAPMTLSTTDTTQIENMDA